MGCRARSARALHRGGLGSAALGAFYVAGSITSAPKLGAVTLITVILAGQAFASRVVDHFGMVGFDEHPATLGRVLGVALIACGVLFVRLF